MKSATDEPVPTRRFHARAMQLAVAAPSFLAWVLLIGLSLVWFLSVTIGALSGRLVASGDGRFFYLVVVQLFLLVCGVCTARTLWRAYKGQSPLWWHGATLGAALMFFVLLGIVGD